MLGAAFAALLFAVPVSAMPDDVEQTFDFGGVARSYWVHNGAGPAQRPLVLVFHGSGGSAQRMGRFTGFSALAEKNGFVVVYPQGVNAEWNDERGISGRDEDDVDFVGALIDRLIAEYRVDPKRVYAAGISNGGFFSYALACRMSDRIAAIAPVAAAMPRALEHSCKPARAVPIVSFSGTSDPIVPYRGGAIGLQSGPAPPELGGVMSAPASFALWKQLDGCASSADTTARAVARDPDGTSTTDLTSACGGRLQLYTINGGGHTWPGGEPHLPFIVGITAAQPDASALMWEFFSRIHL